MADNFKDINFGVKLFVGLYIFALASCLDLNSWKFEEETNLTNFYDRVAYKPCRYSFLEYMLELRESQFAGSTQAKQFENECREPVYDFTTYHAMVYIYVCVFKSKQKFELFCDELQHNNGKMKFVRDLLNIQNSTYSNLLNYSLFFQNLTNLQISACYNIQRYVWQRENFKKKVKKKPHVQSKKTVFSRYNENILEDVPFCFPFTCPYWKNGERASSFKKTVYDCMPFSCKVAFWLIFTLDSVFAVSVIIANMIIIIVIKKTPHLLTSHGYFSLSLALADLIVGVITEPCIAYSFYVTYRGPVSAPVNSNLWYLNISGFFTALSLCASLLSLIGTSAYRFLAVIRPNFYWRRRALVIKSAMYVIVVIWIVSACLGLTPILRIIPGDRYFIHPMGMTLSYQMDNLYLYSATVSFGLLVIWILTLLPCAIMRRKKKQHRNSQKRLCRDNIMVPSHVPSSFRMSNKFKRLDRTLRTVVVAFTISYLPLVVTQSFAKSDLINLSQNPETFDIKTNFVFNAAMFISSRLILANSFANFIIYNVKNKEFLTAAKRIFRKSRARNRMLPVPST